MPPVANECILLVDDAVTTRSFLSETILIPEGYGVVTAVDGRHALELVQQQQFDLIISDYLMPEITGLDLLQQLQVQGLSIPFILITAEGSEALAVRAMRMGVRDYLIKPFDIEDLLFSVRRAISETTSIGVADIFGGLDDAILITDHENCLKYYNPTAAQAFQLNGHDIIGSHLREVVPNRDIWALFESVTGSRLEITINESALYNALIHDVPNVGKLAIMRDISHLREVDRAKNDLVTAISHDLRSPLTTILGYVQLLGRAGELNNAQKGFVDNIVFSVNTIKAMLTDLLELSKIEGGFDTTFESVQFDLIIRYAIEAQRSALEKQHHQIAIELAPNMPRILGNPIRLKQIVVNLLENAIKYTPEGGYIGVKLYRDNNFLILQVSDSGIGISPDAQQYIWDKFYRSEDVLEKYEGTGLGLAIVKGIIEKHGGRIWVDSAPSKGSTFTVMLPAEESEPDA